MILLDTSLLIILADGDPIRQQTRERLIAATLAQQLWVSAVSAWELGLLATRTGKTGPQIGDARLYFDAVVAGARIQTLPLTDRIALAAAYLPGPFHRDPSDRMIIATARSHDLTLITIDRRILDYAALGYVRAIRA